MAEEKPAEQTFFRLGGKESHYKFFQETALYTSSQNTQTKQTKTLCKYEVSHKRIMLLAHPIFK